MTEPIQDTIQSILVAIDNTRRGDATLEAAAQLAAELQAELQGLFVEDENLLRLARMPFACEIGATTALARPLTPESIERTFRAKADEAKRSLKATAQRLQVQWSFQIRRGQFLETTFAAAEEADVMVLEPHIPSRVKRLFEKAPPIIVIVDGSLSAVRALRIALYFCRHVVADLTVCLAPISSVELDDLRYLTNEIIGQEPLPKNCHVAVVSTPASIAGELENQKVGFRFALLSRTSLLSDEPDLQSLIQQLRCPLALVR